MSSHALHAPRKENAPRAGTSPSRARPKKRRSTPVTVDEPELSAALVHHSKRKPTISASAPARDKPWSGADLVESASPSKPPKGSRRAKDETRESYTGGIAAAEFERLRKENEALKKRLNDEKTVSSKQRKLIDSLKRNNHHQSTQVEMLKAKSEEDEEVISTFESNLTCSICLETLLKPFALPPCGHVFCYSCLRDWFIRSPADNESMDEDDEDVLLRRRKSCPTCRGTVLGRPLPLFVVKSLAHALIKARPQDGVPKAASPPPTGEDPWEGIFYPDAYTPSDDDSSDDDSDDDGLSAQDEDSEMADSDDNDAWSEYGYGTGSDESAYEGEYVRPRWAPPGTRLDPGIYALDALAPEERALLRRGASLPMAATYRMHYTHAHGITAALPPPAARVVHLGWNISLHPGDPLGGEYMEWVRRDMAERRERWQTRRAADGTVATYKLVRAEDAFAYDTSDSEAYALPDEDGE